MLAIVESLCYCCCVLPPHFDTTVVQVDPDGIKRSVKTTINADGTKTVEETSEHPDVTV